MCPARPTEDTTPSGVETSRVENLRQTPVSVFFKTLAACIVKLLPLLLNSLFFRVKGATESSVAVDTAPPVAVDTAGDPSPSIERGVETSPPLSDRDVQCSNSDSGLADVGEGEAALWGDGCLDDIDMIELADLVSFFFFFPPRERSVRER